MAGKLSACKSVKLVNLTSLRQNSNCGNVVSESLIIRRESFFRNLQRLNGFWTSCGLRDSLDPINMSKDRVLIDGWISLFKLDKLMQSIFNKKLKLIVNKYIKYIYNDNYI